MIGVRTLRRFRGLNNVDDPMRGTATGTDNHESWEWQQTADNVDGTDSEGLARREGYTAFLAATSITGAFTTFDYSRLYIVDNGALKRVSTDGTTLTLQSGLSGTPYWTEINDDVYLSCGAQQLRIASDNTVSVWGVPVPAQPTLAATSGQLYAGVVQVALTYTDSTGREGGASPSVEVSIGETGGVTANNIPQLAGYTVNLYCTEPDGTVFYLHSRPTASAHTVVTLPAGPELTTQFLDTPPAGQYLAAFGANLYVAEYVAATDQTVVWFSQPMGYHLFNLNSDYFVVPGQITQLFGSSEVLLVTTHNRIFLYNNDKLQQVAEYGAVPGQHCDIGPDGKLYFWTKRGLCRAAPFENMTESRVSVAPGVYAGGGIVEKGGYRKYVAVIHQGGDAFNRR